MSKENKGGFLSGKGFYVALFLGAMAIGFAGYLYYANAKKDQTMAADQPVTSVAVVEPGTTQVVPNTTEPVQQPTETVPEGKPQKRVRPLEGETLAGFALDMLCYNETTRDWRTHDGVDIAAQAGTAVVAAADGQVVAVCQDDRLGMTVVLSHSGGYTTTYSSLGEEIPVSAGQTVTAGQVIGTVANTALMEYAIGDHLHFSVACNGESQDPAEFLAIDNG